MGEEFWAAYIDFNEIDFSNNVNLELVRLSNVDVVTYVDLSNQPNLNNLGVFSCSDIEYINVKNGSIESTGVYLSIPNQYNVNTNSSLQYICVDEVQYQYAYNEYSEYYSINTYCSFIPGGEYYIIEGDVKIDLDANGCDPSDSIYPNLKFEITTGATIGTFISNSDGTYNFPVFSGTSTLTSLPENSTYFSVSPSSITVDFPTDISPFTQDFCVTPNGAFNDLEITIIPLEAARPGFDADYKIVYKNKGTTILSGDIDFGFQDEVMEFISSTPANESGLTDLLSYSFTDLSPFESREITLTMNLNAPTDVNPLNGDDVLSFITSINSSET